MLNPILTSTRRRYLMPSAKTMTTASEVIKILRYIPIGEQGFLFILVSKTNKVVFSFSLYQSIYIYIYMCVCVCVCVCGSEYGSESDSVKKVENEY